MKSLSNIDYNFVFSIPLITVRQVIALILLSLFFLQAIPVSRLFADTKKASLTASILDEDNSDETKGKEKKESKEYLSVPDIAVNNNRPPIQYHSPVTYVLPSPYCESFTPPPDFTC